MIAPDFERAMRIGSLEITTALAAVALLAARPRIRAAAEIGALSPDARSRSTFSSAERAAHTARELRSRSDAIQRPSSCCSDAEVSRRHARFESQQGIVYVDDLKSSNGTFLNGRRVNEAIEVRSGERSTSGRRA